METLKDGPLRAGRIRRGSYALKLKTDEQGWMAPRVGDPVPPPQGDTEVCARWTLARLTEDPGLQRGWLRSPEAFALMPGSPAWCKGFWIPSQVGTLPDLLLIQQ